MTAIVITLIIVAIIFIAKTSSKQSKKTSQEINEITPMNTSEPFNVKIDYKGDWYDTNDEKGILTINKDGSIHIQTHKEFGVTLIGATEKTANNIMNICDTDDSFYEWAKAVGFILMENRIRLKEVEEFRAQVRPIVEQRVNKLIAKDNEWDNLGECDREDKRKEYINDSMVKFEDYVSPAMSGALTYLAFNTPFDIPLLNEIITDYGTNNMSTYCEYYGKKKPIITISNVKYRKPLEELVRHGLAYTGIDMCIEELLSSLTLAELNKIAACDKKFTRKDKAIKFLSEKENIADIIEQNIALRALFVLSPLPEKFKEFNIEKYKELQNYYNELAYVLITLYKGFCPIHYH